MKNNEYTLDELIYMRNNLTKYAESLRGYDDSKIDYETIAGVLMYLTRLDEIILKKISEDNKNDNFANYGLCIKSGTLDDYIHKGGK